MNLSKLLHINYQISILFVFPCLSLFGQEKSFETYKKDFAGNQLVQTLHKEVVKIDIVKGITTVRSFFTDEHIVLDSRAASILTEDEIEFSEFEEITDIVGYSTNFATKSSKKIQATDFKTRDVQNDGMIFHDGNQVTQFLFPGLQEGSKRHLSYTSTYKEMRFPFGFSFYSYFPIEKAVFEIDHDTSVHLLRLDHNLEGFDYTFEEKVVKNRRIWTFTSTSCKTIKFEDHMPKPIYFSPAVYMQIAYINGKNGRENVLGTLPDLVDWYSKNVVKSMGQEPSEELKNITLNLVKDKTTELEKVKAIYYWVQSNIKYIAFEEGTEGFIPRNPNQVCEKRYGDCKDMGSLIYKMLTIADIKGYIAWIGSRDLPFKYSKFPSTLVDNHMIAVYYHEGKPLFLDATSSFQPIEYPTYFILEKEALVYGSKSDYRIENVLLPSPEMTGMLDTTYIELDGRKILGSSETYLTGYYKILSHEMLANQKERPITNKIESITQRGNNSFKVTEGEIRNFDERDLPMEVAYDFEIDNYVTSYEGETYVNMILDKDLVKEKELKSTRKNAFTMDFYSKDRYTVILDVPADKVVKSVPKNASYSSPIVDYSVEYVLEEGEVVMTLTLAFKFMTLEPKDFKLWNDFITVMKNSTSETVVLKNK
jgi:hypothetical protein